MSEPKVKTRAPFLVFGAPSIENAEIEEVIATLKSGWIGTGPKASQFEREFAEYKGVPHAIAVNSCTAALHLSLVAAGVGPGDEVITTPLTFCATVNAIIHAGAVPVIADVDPVTMNLDPSAVQEKLSPRTRALLPVHFAGRPCDMDALCDLAASRELTLIEDCAHAIETEYKGRKAGTFGDFSCFSFYVTKNLTTAEGGMVLVRDEEQARRVRTLGLHGMSRDAWKRFGDGGYRHYEVLEAGFKYNMTDLQAALGLHQLKRVELYWGRRNEIWRRYQEAFADLPVDLPAPPEAGTRHAHHLYTLLIDPERSPVTRDEFIDRMTEHRIGVGVHYLALPEHRFYQDSFGWRPEDYPVATSIGRRTVSIPLSAKLTDSDVKHVIQGVRESLRG